MEAGKLRERIIVEQASDSRNSIGETVQVWSEFASTWASVDGVSARESLLFGQQQVSVSHRVRMRYLPGMTHGMRLQWRGRTLEIISLLEQKNRTEYELLCQETI